MKKVLSLTMVFLIVLFCFRFAIRGTDAPYVSLTDIWQTVSLNTDYFISLRNLQEDIEALGDNFEKMKISVAILATGANYLPDTRLNTLQVIQLFLTSLGNLIGGVFVFLFDGVSYGVEFVVRLSATLISFVLV